MPGVNRPPLSPLLVTGSPKMDVNGRYKHPHIGRHLFNGQNVLRVAEMRLILIREPIITLLPLLSRMLTTASPPVCLSFNMTIYLCLPAWSQSLCQPACVSLPLSPLWICCMPSRLPGCKLDCASFLEACSFVCFFLYHHVIRTVITCFLPLWNTRTGVARRHRCSTAALEWQL